MEPVAPDTFMRSMMIVRLQRDANGIVVGFDYGNPLVRHLRFTRLGDRKESSPSARVPEPVTAAEVGQVPSLEKLVGEYEMAPGRTLVVTLDDGRLYGEPTGNPKLPLKHVSGSTFCVEGRPITLRFTVGLDGRATALVMQQYDNSRTLPKIR